MTEVLDSLEARDLIPREASCRIEGDGEFSFEHILIREVAYRTLLARGDGVSPCTSLAGGR